MSTEELVLRQIDIKTKRDETPSFDYACSIVRFLPRPRLLPLPSMLISDLLQADQISLDLKSSDGPSAIREVAALTRSNPVVTSWEGFCKELLAREQVESTCLGNGVAFPHARTNHIKGMVLTIGRSKKGISFASGGAVHLLFAIGTPKRLATDYLSVVGSLARILKEAPLRDQLLIAPDKETFIDLIAAAEKKI